MGILSSLQWGMVTNCVGCCNAVVGHHDHDNFFIWKIRKFYCQFPVGTLNYFVLYNFKY